MLYIAISFFRYNLHSKGGNFSLVRLKIHEVSNLKEISLLNICIHKILTRDQGC